MKNLLKRVRKFRVKIISLDLSLEIKIIRNKKIEKILGILGKLSRGIKTFKRILGELINGEIIQDGIMHQKLIIIIIIIKKLLLLISIIGMYRKTIIRRKFRENSLKRIKRITMLRSIIKYRRRILKRDKNKINRKMNKLVNNHNRKQFKNNNN